ncbi:hypothetical protein TNIN_481231 [Trichonephila inaurata madagascariensis]|uniref:Uncharacterized protein n=1 Tax=Trichonephila inaurata madagascariensis TaxID=2747483 RepID=A0A8X6XPC4_9ARAC|nr:hypothetical protein TNIN_481231 [Trichonephila inaurata madagascariensis]
MRNEEVEAVRESRGDALDIHESTFDDNKLSNFLPDQRDKRVSKPREWLSASLTGSVNRATPKISRPSRNEITTSAEIHNEEGPLRIKPSVTKKKRHAGLFQFKNQPCIYYGPETIEVLESIEIPEREPKKDGTSKNISNNTENLNRNATLSDSTKDTRQINNKKSKELRGEK